MSIANEIQRIQSAKADIKSAIENKGVTVGDGTIDTYAKKIDEISVGSGDYDQGYEDGKNSVVNYLALAKTVQFNSLNDFGKAEVELNFGENLTSLSRMFYVGAGSSANTILEYITINCLGIVTDMSDFMNCTYALRDTVLKKITLNFDTKNVTRVNNAFNCLVAVEVYDGTPFDLSSATNINNMFNYNNALKEVRFIANSIPLSISFGYCLLLSDTSIQSIIDGLADLTGGTAQTLTLHATVGAKLTDEQKATITAKNWTLVY